MLRLFFCVFLLFSNLFSLPSVNELTLEEKVGQLLLIHLRGEFFNEEMKRILDQTHAGGIIYFPFANGLHNEDQVRNLSAAIQGASTIPLLIAIDQEGGRVSPYCPMPSQREQALLDIKSLTFKIGTELKKAGINVNLSPVVDVDSNPENPIIGNRSFSSNPEVVIACAREAIQGYREASLLCCLKHFPGHGDSLVDSHLGLPVIQKSIAELENTEFAPFYALHDQVDFIMTGHLLVPALDDQLPATLSPKILTHLLREKWGYQGAIISDSLIMRALSSCHSSLKEIALHAFNAGCDILCISGRITSDPYFEPNGEDFLEIHSFLVNSVRDGRISEKRLDESVKRILQLKAKYCL